MMRMSMGTAALGMALMLTACGEAKPEGQVVATIGGEEVTLPELNAEIQAAGVPQNADRKEVSPLILQRVIDRKLLAKAAAEQGVDKSPEYLVQERRLDENLLVQLYLRQQFEAVSVPSAADVDRFIRENPSMFAERERLLLDQIRFERPRDTVQLQRQLAPAKTMDQVIAVLQRNNLRFERGRSAVDTGTLPKEAVDQINKLPAGEIFVLPQSNMLLANVIVGRQALPVPNETARAIAARALRQQNAEKAIRQQLDGLRSGAQIEYQPGYAPPPATPAGRTPPAAAGGAAAAGAASAGAAPAAAGAAR